MNTNAHAHIALKAQVRYCATITKLHFTDVEYCNNKVNYVRKPSLGKIATKNPPMENLFHYWMINKV